MDEEKEHVAALTTILHRIDGRQDGHFRWGHAERIEAGGSAPKQGQKPAPIAAQETLEAVISKGERPAAPGLIVGSLISARAVWSREPPSGSRPDS